MGGAWGSDPWKRYVYRWYTDLGWTEYVSDGARQYVDPPGDRGPAARTPPPASAHAPLTAATPATASSPIQQAPVQQAPVREVPATPVLPTGSAPAPPAPAVASSTVPTAPVAPVATAAAVTAVMPRTTTEASASSATRPAAPAIDHAPDAPDAPHAATDHDAAADAADAGTALALALGSPATEVDGARPTTGVPRTSATGATATAAATTGTTGTTGTTVASPHTSAGAAGRARSADAPTSERLRWVWIGAGMVASFTLGALVFGGRDGGDAQAVDTPAVTTVTVPETVSTTVPLTVASTLPPTLPETSPPTTTTTPVDPAQVAGNDRQIDDVEWFVLTANFRDQFGFDIPPRDVATTLGTQACDAAAASTTAVEFDAALRPLIAASGLSFTRATQAMGAFGGVMCVDEFVKFLPPPSGG